jgi:hypothetical protein
MRRLEEGHPHYWIAQVARFDIHVAKLTTRHLPAAHTKQTHSPRYLTAATL